MLPYQSIFESLNQIVVQQFGELTTINFYPQQSDDNTGPSPIQIQGVVRLPKPEDTLPGGLDLGPTNIALFVDLNAITPKPSKGDLISINGTGYFIRDTKIDAVGGAFLILQKDGKTYA